MRIPQRPWFHARSAVPLTGREPVLGHLAARLAWRGPGWGLVVVRGPDGAGRTRVLAEAVHRAGGDAPLVVLPTGEDEAAGEALRRAFLGLLPPGDREETVAALALRLGRRDAEARVLAAWVLDGVEAGAEPPDVDALRHALRALVDAGPLVVDDLDRLDVLTRRVVEGETGPGGLGVLAASAIDGRAAEVHPLPPLGLSQVELLLRRWLRHPVTVRRLTPRVLDGCEGQPGRIVRRVRSLGRAGALAADSRGVRIVRWPLPQGDGRRGVEGFQGFATALPYLERGLLEAAALAAHDEEPALLARAVGGKRRLAADLQVEIAERWPSAGHGLFPSRADRAALAGGIEASRRRDLGARLARAWQRRAAAQPLRGTREAVAWLRAALAAEDEALVAEARAALLRLLPADLPSRSTLARLLAETEGGMPAPAAGRGDLGPAPRDATVKNAT